MSAASDSDPKEQVKLDALLDAAADATRDADALDELTDKINTMCKQREALKTGLESASGGGGGAGGGSGASTATGSSPALAVHYGFNKNDEVVYKDGRLAKVVSSERHADGFAEIHIKFITNQDGTPCLKDCERGVFLNSLRPSNNMLLKLSTKEVQAKLNIPAEYGSDDMATCDDLWALADYKGRGREGLTTADFIKACANEGRRVALANRGEISAGRLPTVTSTLFDQLGMPQGRDFWTERDPDKTLQHTAAAIHNFLAIDKSKPGLITRKIWATMVCSGVMKLAGLLARAKTILGKKHGYEDNVGSNLFMPQPGGIKKELMGLIARLQIEDAKSVVRVDAPKKYGKLAAGRQWSAQPSAAKKKLDQYPAPPAGWQVLTSGDRVQYYNSRTGEYKTPEQVVLDEWIKDGPIQLTPDQAALVPRGNDVTPLLEARAYLQESGLDKLGWTAEPSRTKEDEITYVREGHRQRKRPPPPAFHNRYFEGLLDSDADVASGGGGGGGGRRGPDDGPQRREQGQRSAAPGRRDLPLLRTLTRSMGGIVN